MDLSVSDLMSATPTRLVSGEREARLTGCAIDSRKVAAGDLFVAFVGESSDGNDYAAAAAEAGAACVVMTREPSASELERIQAAGCAVLCYASPEPDPERLLLSVASLWRSLHTTWVVVAVTGSVGKTTTKEMLAAALGTTYRVHATEGNYNSPIGMALTLLATPADADAVVLEMGMNHEGELWRQTLAARPNLAVITNIGTAHIGNLGSREGIARAKAEVCAGLEASPFVPGGGRRLFMCGEDDFMPLIRREYCDPAGIDMTLVGTQESDAVRAVGTTLDEGGHARLDVAFADGGTCPLALSVPGTHVVPDALLAFAVADLMRCDRAAVADAIGATRPYQMRLDVRSVPGSPRVLDDTYNASPASMAGALDVLCALPCEGRRIAVLGEMGELGEEEARLHALVGAYAAAKGLDMLAVVGQGPAAEMVDGAKTMGMSSDRIERFASVDDAARTLVPILAPDDLVLVKASRAAELDRFVQEVLDR